MDQETRRSLVEAGEVLESALASALDRTIGDEASARHEEEAQRERRVERAGDAVKACCAAAWSEALEGLADACPELMGINYLQRYDALKGVGDRERLLGLIEQTIARAESLVEAVPQIDFGTVFARVAKGYRSALLRLDELVAGAGGERLGEDGLPAFTGEVVSAGHYDAAEVLELARLIRSSFATYRKVVEDNGVFAAFSEGSDYGRCKGYSFGFAGWDDYSCEEFDFRVAAYMGTRPGASGGQGIPSTVEEDDCEGGDTPARAIERMREFNRRRYYGMLDDDYAVHVDAFWYGFRKLMEFANDLVEVDDDQLCAWRSDLRDALVASAREFAVHMDDEQTDAFIGDVSALIDA